MKKFVFNSCGKLTWEDLSQEEKDWWDKYAKKHQKFLSVYKYIMENSCILCKFKPKNWVGFQFHYYSTHGISPKMFKKYLKE